jgi:ferredoxin
MYADIFGTIPIAEALLSKGAELGSILSFMMAVTTLSLPSMIMLRKAVKPKLLALFIASAPSALFWSVMYSTQFRDSFYRNRGGICYGSEMVSGYDYLSCKECGACIAKCSHGVYDSAKAPTPLSYIPWSASTIVTAAAVFARQARSLRRRRHRMDTAHKEQKEEELPCSCASDPERRKELQSSISILISTLASAASEQTTSLIKL